MEATAIRTKPGATMNISDCLRDPARLVVVVMANPTMRDRLETMGARIPPIPFPENDTGVYAEWLADFLKLSPIPVMLICDQDAMPLDGFMGIVAEIAIVASAVIRH